jgi:hypothetical protein
MVVIDSGNSQTAGFQIPCGPTNGIRLPANENASRDARDSASPCSWRCSVSQSNTARLISMSREPITPSGYLAAGRTEGQLD